MDSVQKQIAYTSLVSLVALGFAAGLSGQSTGTNAKGKAKAASPEQAMVDKYCMGCHSARVKSGNFVLEGVDFSRIGEHAETGEKIVRKLRSGMMPPSGSPRPDAATYESVSSAIEKRLDAAAAANPMLPAPGAHRLNRREYANSVRDLLALEVDPAGLLPVDDSSYGFDNMAGTLGSSPALVEAYVAAASKISRMALGHELGATLKVYPAPPDYSQNRRNESLAFGTRGGMSVEHYFPADGEYAIDWTPVRSNAGGLFGNTTGEMLEMTLDGERIHLYDTDKEVPRGGGTAADKHPTRVHVKAGLHTVGVAFIARTHMPADDFNKHFERTTLTQNVPGFTFAMHVNSMSIAGPFNAQRPDSTVSRDKILVCKPANESEETACAKTILSKLARQAFRRPITDRDTERLLSLYQQGRNDGDFEDGIERGLQMILSDPEFVYRTERVPANVASGKTYSITDLELASRLSYFLWSSAPDEQLITLASQNKLRANLEAQVKRMLADPKSSELINNFAGQWLQIRNLQATAPVGDIFPDFDDNLRQAFKTETLLFFESIVREDRNVADLLDADYTFVNERLAKHYGIPNIYGSQFRKIKLGPDLDVRRGLLGQGSILTLTSISDRTSPVQRGKWVLQNIMGVLPPPPPPNVPQLKTDDETGPRKIQSMRERMELHRANPSCASCHKMFDPIGFAMENFDGIGKYRTTEGGRLLDLSGTLVDGTKFAGTAELRKVLLRYTPLMVQTMTERMMTYAVGRGAEYYDMPSVRAISRSAAAKNNRFSVIVMGIVESPQFQKNQVPSGDLTASNK